MNQLSQLRLEIENLHQELFQFILKRKDVVEKIWTLKKKSGLDMIDQTREENLIGQFDQSQVFKNDPDLKEFYHQVVKNIIVQSKNYAQKP